MMMNLFNLFDPMILNIPLNYYLFILFIFFFNKNTFWLNNLNFIFILMKNMKKEMLNLNPIMNKNMILLFMSILMILFYFNMMNLIPNIFYISSNISMSLNLSLYLIMMFFFFNLINNKNIFFMNLTPKNTPLFLILIINLIELNSFFIQIITLNMRLMINMTLGHLIIMIINNFMLTTMYMMIELFIILIQSYVFYILILMNFNNMY